MRHAFPYALLLTAAPLALVPAAVSAQTEIIHPPTPNADELAAQMRLLAADPKDLNALVRAGELTLRLDDPTAAAGFFARAERIDPHNPRVEAGMGSLLVGEERPAEALRRFMTAEGLGADPRSFAADRGLAYDLLGEQERAQRDYRLALHTESSDETARRYALSLGISGKRDEAFKILDPLLRQSDRGAWRARAFILAMAGDRSGAERIATSMMPPGMAQGLQPFFERLPALSAADRAFAVHFGETRPTPERIADARLMPPLPALGADPYPPVRLAALEPAPAPSESRSERRRGKKRNGAAIDVATTAPPVPLPAPPTYVASNTIDPQALTVQPLPSRPAYPYASTTTVQPLPSRAMRGTLSTAMVQPLPESAAPKSDRSRAAPVSLAAANVMAGPARAGPTPVASRPDTSAEGPSLDSGEEDDTPAPARASAPPPVVAAPVAQAPAPSPASEITTTSIPPSVDAPQPVVAPPPPAPKPAPVRSEDSILASIIAGVKVPNSETERAPDPVPAPRPARAQSEPEKSAAVPGKKTAETAKPVDPKKAAADKKAAEAKKAAAEKKAAEAKKAADEKKAAKADPARIWVQVAGGANEDTLPKEWARVREKAPAAFKGKQGWTTPLRATNRVLTGPFKTDEEARAFVNTLAKAGLSAFTFSSEAGQKITRLPAK